MRKSKSFDGVAIFAAVGKRLSFTTAAKQLSMSQSTASQAYAIWRQGLARFCWRTTRGIRPTDAGSDYLAAIAPAFGQLERVTQEIERRSLEPAGHLRLILPRAAFEWRVA
jgi:DNA-binding transcriptional LysR family regulator